VLMHLDSIKLPIKLTMRSIKDYKMVSQYSIVNLYNQDFLRELPQKSKRRMRYICRRKYPVRKKRTTEKLPTIKFKKKIKRMMMIIRRQNEKV